MNISIIVAVSENQVIGVDNQLPWHLPADLRYFKSLTTNHPIIMGRKTYDSIGRPLPNRENIIITRNTHFKHDGLVVVHSIEAALQHCQQQQHDEVFIIGGDTIYQQSISMANRIYLTRVHTYIEHGTAFFPVLDETWQLVSAEAHTRDEKNDMDYTFEVYEKNETMV